jgi:hypothetical protein
MRFGSRSIGKYSASLRELATVQKRKQGPRKKSVSEQAEAAVAAAENR